MEVHHQPIQPQAGEKKRFKEYFLEFLMLFLAVTLGFFAENLREHSVEKKREHEFAKALYTEFYNDSIVAANKLSIRLEKENVLSYLSKYFRDSSLTNLPREFYPAFAKGLYTVNIYAFEPKDGVLNQLINSGSLRYFKNVGLQKFLGDISVSIHNLRMRNEQEYMFFSDPIKHFVLAHFDFNWIDSVRNSNTEKNVFILLNNYLESGKTIKAEILNPGSLDRKEAANMISMQKQMLISTRTLQLNDYIITNHNVLDQLRRNYKIQ